MRTITDQVPRLSGGERERRAMVALRTSELSCQIAFGIPQTPTVDSCRPPDITLITETFLTSQSEQQLGVSCFDSVWGARRVIRNNTASFCRSKPVLSCAVFISGGDVYIILRQAEFALLT